MLCFVCCVTEEILSALLNVTTCCLHRELVNQRLCLTHPYIITLHEVFLTPDHLCIAMEYADGGDLTQFVCNYVTHLVRLAAF